MLQTLCFIIYGLDLFAVGGADGHPPALPDCLDAKRRVCLSTFTINMFCIDRIICNLVFARVAFVNTQYARGAKELSVWSSGRKDERVLIPAKRLNVPPFQV